MGSKRSAAAHGAAAASGCTPGWPSGAIAGDVADELYEKLAAFANYGFPESHSVSFAYLVYASSWLKLLRPGGVLRRRCSTPSRWASGRPHTLVQDARRHGVVVRTPDLNASLAGATLEPTRPTTAGGGGRAAGAGGRSRGLGDRARPTASATSWPSDRRRPAVHRPWRTSPGGCRRSRSPSSRRWPPPVRSASASGWRRREALWAAGAVAQSRPGPPARHRHRRRAPPLPGMRRRRRRWPTCGPPAWRRTATPRGSCATQLDERGRGHRRGLWDVEPGRGSLVAGVVTHRQRPMTAQGTTFLNLEDETGLINVVVSKGCWARFRRVARGAPAMTIRGRLERVRGRHQRGGRAPRRCSSCPPARPLQPRLPLTALDGGRAVPFAPTRRTLEGEPAVAPEVTRGATMTMYGANPDELTALGNKLTAQVDVIATLIGDVNGVLTSTTWQGPARDRFEGEWTGSFASSLKALQDAFGAAGTECRSRAAALAQVMGATDLSRSGHPASRYRERG